MPHDSTSDLIISDPAILAGKPVIAGSRFSVQLILEKLRDGWTIDDLLDDYSQLSHEQVIAAIAHAWNHQRQLDLGDDLARGLQRVRRFVDLFDQNRMNSDAMPASQSAALAILFPSAASLRQRASCGLPK